MRRLSVFLAWCGLALVGCANPEPSLDMKSGAQYWFDLGQNTQVGDEVYAGVGGWTNTYSCERRSAGTGVAVSALRIDDARGLDWDLERDGGTPPPRTGSGNGISLEVTERDGGFDLALILGPTTFRATAPENSAAVGFHHVTYQTPPELLTVKNLDFGADDGTTRTVTGTVSFPDTCVGIAN